MTIQQEQERNSKVLLTLVSVKRSGLEGCAILFPIVIISAQRMPFASMKRRARISINDISETDLLGKYNFSWMWYKAKVKAKRR